VILVLALGHVYEFTEPYHAELEPTPTQQILFPPKPGPFHDQIFNPLLTSLISIMKTFSRGSLLLLSCTSKLPLTLRRSFVIITIVSYTFTGDLLPFRFIDKAHSVSCDFAHYLEDSTEMFRINFKMYQRDIFNDAVLSKNGFMIFCIRLITTCIDHIANIFYMCILKPVISILIVGWIWTAKYYIILAGAYGLAHLYLEFKLKASAILAGIGLEVQEWNGETDVKF